jgi:pimeloyl-ACP methyl ester carboxylesterase
LGSFADGNHRHHLPGIDTASLPSIDLHLKGHRMTAPRHRLSATDLQRRTLLTLPGAALLPTFREARAASTPQDNAMNSLPAPSFASINDGKVFYEVRGRGKPLVLLHGGIGASEMFGPNLDELAKSRQVVAVHLQGHGRTPDVDRPLRFELLADDVAALMAKLDLKDVDLMGYSFGGGVALQVVLRHPGAVDRLVLVSTPASHDGYYPEVLAGFAGMKAAAPQIAQGLKAHSPLAAPYPGVNWETLFSKMGELQSRPYDWSAALATIGSPVMLVFADADALRYEHVVEMYRRLGGARRDAGLDGSLRPATRLAILPGTTHYDILATTAVADIVAPFLDAPRPRTA